MMNAAVLDAFTKVLFIVILRHFLRFTTFKSQICQAIQNSFCPSSLHEIFLHTFGCIYWYHSVYRWEI